MLGEKVSCCIDSLVKIKHVFRRLSLRTQLLLILLFVLAISVSSLSIIYARSEEMIIEKVTDNLDDITKAIQISVEELTYRGDSTQRLKSYVDMLNRKGIREISIIGDDAQVIASSNPKKIGTVENPKRVEGQERVAQKKDLLITARLGEESRKEGQRLYNVIMPVSIKGQNLGYIHISMILDDYKYLQRRNHLKRILSTVFAFSIGILVSLVLAKQYTDPIRKIADASRDIAEGKLVKIRDNERKDEIGVLVRSFNEMVEKLSERKELEDKLKKTEQLSMIGQLASGIAHEVRNPLNFLSLSIGHIKERLAEEKIAQGDDINDLLESLKKEIYRVNELINNFLSLGRPIVLNREMISPKDLFQDALYMVKDKIRDGIRIVTDCAEKNMRIYCDREYMRLCLINLILNSAQAIEEDGVVKVGFSTENGMSCIAVEDNGKGVQGEDLKRIFEPYFSTKKMGIGLGLTITRRLVEEHGGTISAESTAGQKTVITIRVPNHEVS
ncbi:MAG: Sensor protein ZraS [Syntrophorhabdaceae bacterium PtaU1.Bin034]|nr:MAG: Sensor protein ZraS [Syntrophorhabdaceae bacterium PtaU1.Bin034]